MRLPSLTRRQTAQEGARELHEELWQAFRAEGPSLTMTSTPETVEEDRKRVVGNLHKFWDARGYTLCSSTRGDKSGYRIWLEAKAGQTEDPAA